MKIISLQAENFKKLVAVEIHPNGNVVTLTGKNAQGKTSVLDSIWVALAGMAASPKKPIREGQKKARIRLDLGDIIVERKFNESGTSLTVQNAQGAEYRSPQTMLDALLGELCFDPLAFARMEPKEQFDELRRVSKVDVDLDELDELNKRDYESRTGINRDAKAKRNQAQAILVLTNLPKEPIDESKLLTEFQTAADGNAKIEHVEELAQKKLTEAKALQTKLDTAEALPEPADLSKLKTNIEEARQTNKKIADKVRRDQIETEARALEEKSESLTEAMAEREQRKLDAIAKAQMPIEGLGFGDGVVTFKGIPLEQVSDSEKLKISLGIAMAANPKLRIIRIQDGSLLDDDGLKQIGRMAKENDYQVWLEKVDGTGKVGIVIEDGAVIAVNEEAA